MDGFQSLSHTVWECNYHIVWIPKYRRKALYGDLREHLSIILRELAVQREQHIGRAPQAGPYSHADLHSAEVCSGTGGWFH
jgi:hypothetical protein